METNYNKSAHKKDEIKRVLGSIVFVIMSWAIFFIIFLGSLIYGIMPLTPLYPKYLKTIEIEEEDGSITKEDVNQGYYAVSWLGESNEFVSNGSLIYVRSYDPAINNLVIGAPAFYYHETFNAETSILESSILVCRIITDFKVSDDFRYAYVSSTNLSGEDAISEQRVRYDAMIGSLVENEYTEIPVLGLWQNIAGSSVIVSVIISIVLAFFLLVTPILLALKLRSHGYGMGNRNEQARVFNPALALVICSILFLVLSFGLTVPYYTTSLGTVIYKGEEATVNDVTFANKTMYSYSVYHATDNPLESGSIFAYTKRTPSRVEGEKNVAELAFAEFSSGSMEFVYADDGVTIKDAYMKVFYSELGSTDVKMMELYIGDIVGIINAPIPVFGTVLSIFNSSIFATLATIFLLAVLLLLPPSWILAKRIKVARRESPFTDGIDLEKLNKEAKFIYSDIRSFLTSGGLSFAKDYGCDKVYVNNKLFCKITCNKNVVTVLINKDFQRYDGRLDRSGFIQIPHVANLDYAKQRIYKMYTAYFKQYKQQKKRYY